MTEGEEEFIEWWEKNQEMGMLKYILIRGGTFGIVFTFVILLLQLHSNSLEGIFLSGHFANLILISLFASTLAYGSVMWFFNSRKYKKIKKEL